MVSRGGGEELSCVWGKRFTRRWTGGGSRNCRVEGDEVSMGVGGSLEAEVGASVIMEVEMVVVGVCWVGGKLVSWVVLLGVMGSYLGIWEGGVDGGLLRLLGADWELISILVSCLLEGQGERGVAGTRGVCWDVAGCGVPEVSRFSDATN